MTKRHCHCRRNQNRPVPIHISDFDSQVLSRKTKVESSGKVFLFGGMGASSGTALPASTSEVAASTITAWPNHAAAYKVTLPPRRIQLDVAVLPGSPTKKSKKYLKSM